MSYEGYDQLLCENGHYFTADTYEDTDHETWRCEICGAQLAWWNAVDVTNGSFDVNPYTKEEVRIDGYVELEIDKPAQEETYKIPSHVGHGVLLDDDLEELDEDEEDEFGAGL